MQCSKPYFEVLADTFPAMRGLLDQDLAVGVRFPVTVADLESRLPGYKEYCQKRAATATVHELERIPGFDLQSLPDKQAFERHPIFQQALLTARLEYSSAFLFEADGKRLYSPTDSFVEAAQQLPDTTPVSALDLSWNALAFTSRNRTVIDVFRRSARSAGSANYDVPVTIVVFKNEFEGHQKLNVISFQADQNAYLATTKREMMLCPTWNFRHASHTDWDFIDRRNFSPRESAGPGTGGSDHSYYRFVLKMLCLLGGRATEKMSVESPVRQWNQELRVATAEKVAQDLRKKIALVAAADWIELAIHVAATDPKLIEPTAKDILKALEDADGARLDLSDAERSAKFEPILSAATTLIQSGRDADLVDLSAGILKSAHTLRNAIGVFSSSADFTNLRELCWIGPDSVLKLKDSAASALSRIGEIATASGKSDVVAFYKCCALATGNGVRIECWLRSATSSHASIPREFIWDRLDLPCRYEGLALCEVSRILENAELVPGATQKLPTFSEPPLYRFHPERIRSTHKYVKSVLQGLSRVQPSVFPTQAHIDVFMQNGPAMTKETNDAILGSPQRGRDRLARAGDEENEVYRVNNLHIFDSAGKHIFDIPPSLSAMFRRTDVDDVPLDMVKVPYPCIFLRFGPQDDLELSPGWRVDGAYVTEGRDGSMSITLSTEPPSVEDAYLWPIRPEPFYRQIFQPKHRSMTVGHAVDEVLALTKIDVAEIAQMDAHMSDIVRQVDEEEGFKLPDGIEVQNANVYNARHLQEHLPSIHRVYQEALRLVINSLCYLSSYPDDIQMQWPSRAPSHLINQLSSKRPTEVSRAKSKLEALGYVPIHVCGTRFVAPQGTGEGTSAHGMATHWRKGHWIRQAYGEGRKLRKLQWRLPVIVNPGEEEPAGTLYLVS